MCVPQLLIGFESGTIVMWDLRAKRADFRIYYDEVSVCHLYFLTKVTFIFCIKLLIYYNIYTIVQQFWEGIFIYLCMYLFIHLL